MTPDLNQLSAWQYHLPEHLIASRPASRRDESRLMVVDRQRGEIRHGRFRDLPELLQAGDRLVFNNTKVVPARLFGFRTSTRGRWEGLFLSVESDGRWLITGKTRGRLQPGETLSVYPAGSDPNSVTAEQCLTVRLDQKTEQGTWIVSPEDDRDPYAVLEQYGTLPLPPYIGRPVADEEDRQRYQTVFAETPGAIAAPTAGLHFTDQILSECEQRQVTRAKVTLHVGIGTFRPVNSDCLSEHEMHSNGAKSRQQRRRRSARLGNQVAACWLWAPPVSARWNRLLAVGRFKPFAVIPTCSFSRGFRSTLLT
ncbi:MAG: S-adenosylmethionine:tRNA ribosyltransferase-isomerase, partial [Planctomycetaceae bacterium]|nr:S-adenosylmethionine:tRNA ribosyltransferase-isomerase [Planctomycetaceae bacterium]